MGNRKQSGTFCGSRPRWNTELLNTQTKETLFEHIRADSVCASLELLNTQTKETIFEPTRADSVCASPYEGSCCKEVQLLLKLNMFSEVVFANDACYPSFMYRRYNIHIISS